MNNAEKIKRVMELIAEATTIIASMSRVEEPEQNKLARVAVSGLGIDVSPRDLAIDDLACAESVTNLLREVMPGFPIITGTWTLWDKMRKDSRFAEVVSPIAGDIIISPTGTLRDAPFPGHVGIMKDSVTVMANRSSSGTWEEDYTVTTWKDRWARVGFPVYYFRIRA